MGWFIFSIAMGTALLAWACYEGAKHLDKYREAKAQVQDLEKNFVGLNNIRLNMLKSDRAWHRTWVIIWAMIVLVMAKWFSYAWLCRAQELGLL